MKKQSNPPPAIAKKPKAPPSPPHPFYFKLLKEMGMKQVKGKSYSCPVRVHVRDELTKEMRKVRHKLNQMEAMMFKFKNGQKVKDSITGFKGTVTGRCDYISGCRQFLVVPVVGKDGARKEGYWFDEDRLVALDKKGKEMKEGKPPGGPQQSPERTH